MEVFQAVVSAVTPAGRSGAVTPSKECSSRVVVWPLATWVKTRLSAAARDSRRRTPKKKSGGRLNGPPVVVAFMTSSPHFQFHGHEG